MLTAPSQENVVLHADTRAMLIDFSIAASLDDPVELRKFLGTPGRAGLQAGMCDFICGGCFLVAHDVFEISHPPRECQQDIWLQNLSGDSLKPKLWTYLPQVCCGSLSAVLAFFVHI